MARHRSPEPVFSVLFVCTGNVCRSPLAERLGRAYLHEALGERADEVRLVSAGVRAVVGSGLHPDSALVLQGLGGDPQGFRARQLLDHMVVDADLTLTMTRAQRREVLELAPRVLSRTFTLREAADLVRSIDDDVDRSAGDGLADQARMLVRRLHAARSRRQGGPGDDVRDPIGLPPEVHQETGEAVAAALLPLLERIVGLACTSDDVRRP
ncbi:arsenate reductase/protein-tyrosine-phosphatase family protein [Geodermatophilus amargosae]|uniref:arsenate reductase/protein-tyrosine-phosphatase family protein n=1 Tax=Geodermatophilus amargosae TaxID=1296565 RepID=UPI0034DDF7ED